MHSIRSLKNYDEYLLKIFFDFKSFKADVTNKVFQYL